MSNHRVVSASTLVWTPVEIYDPDGGKYILWPHLPCVESPLELRPKLDPRNLAFLASSEDLWRWKEEEIENEANPGAHVAAASASGTSKKRTVTNSLRSRSPTSQRTTVLSKRWLGTISTSMSS